MEFPDDIRARVRDSYTNARIEAHRLRSEAEVAAELETFWTNFQDYLVRGWVMHLTSLIERESFRFESIKATSDRNIQLIEDAHALATEEVKQVLRRFPALLESAFAESGVFLDKTSMHPKYTLENGFFKLEIDDSKHTARLSDYESSLGEIPADVDAVVEMTGREHRRIFGRPNDGKKFLEFLRTQYNAIIKRDGLRDGSGVPIRSITSRLGKNLKGFRTDEFLIDLSRLASEGPFETDGRRLDFQQTKDTNQGMLLHGGDGRGYIGFILFKEV